MSTKMKGLFKGLRYISHIFEEEKEEEMQIGLPTDVKHVAHIGMDGPSLESPSWLKEFKTRSSSGPLEDDSETKRVSEGGFVYSKKGGSKARDMPEVPRSSRRHHHSGGGGVDSPKKKSASGSTKSKHSRRSDSKESIEGSIRSVRSQELVNDESKPEIPKKTRKKKSE
ncbi:hypothetical protein M569_02043, partial [Genlisea aurea]